MGWQVNCYSMARISIEPFATVSQFAQLVTGTHDVDSDTFQLYAKPIVIGANAWIASNAFVGPGVEVGKGAVLGACGVTFTDLAPWTINVGNPAKMLRMRNDFTMPKAV